MRLPEPVCQWSIAFKDRVRPLLVLGDPSMDGDAGELVPPVTLNWTGQLLLGVGCGREGRKGENQLKL